MTNLDILKEALLDALPSGITEAEESVYRYIIRLTKDIDRLLVKVRLPSALLPDETYRFDPKSNCFLIKNRRSFSFKQVDFPRQIPFDTFIENIKTKHFVLEGLDFYHGC